MTSRIHRGFHRIGVALAVPPLVGVGWLGLVTSWRQFIDRGPWDDYGGAPTYLPDYRLALLLLGLALALYAAARAVGWVLAGFIGPNRT